MQLIRTTISLPVELHEELRRMAFLNRKSMGEVLTEKLLSKKYKVNQVKEDWKLFDAVSRRGKKVNLLTELRKDRGRDDE
ncbi:MAG: hypothetical protein ABII08_02520 [Candidatus Beckwithbacteria bacterium]|nr:hypothetical protein [Patescibacteria group bacterium]